ncbi:MAG: sulfatase-like hydrolase/transferase [Candidatus Coatesbacteria bacterium]|nr:MAG: sulfatase-like hydrolase/transferase [Candidatus Coatesbacteria bacterium]
MRNYLKNTFITLCIAVLISTVHVIFTGCAKSPEERRLERIRSGEERLNIILISIDTLRADALGCYGGEIAETPNIDGLAAGGVLFTECKTPTPLTLPSHTTMLTGTYPPYHGVHINDVAVPGDLVFLSEVLSDNGYGTAGIIGGFPLDDVFGFDQGFDYYDDDFIVGTGSSLSGFEKPANQVLARAETWVEENRDGPFFLFLHFYDPHLLYSPPERFRTKYREAPYFGEVAFVDSVLSGLLPMLETNGLDDRTLIILTSDHGESLEEHGEPTHGFYVYEATQHVPLIMYCPGLIPAGKAIGGSVNVADIYPTVLDILGIEPAKSVQGETLVPSIFGNRKAGKAVYEETYYGAEMFGWARVHALEKDGWKYIDAPEPELYRLSDDPGETDNLAGEEPAKAESMAGELDRLRGKLSENGMEESVSVPLSDTDKARLETLGYLSAATGESVAGTGADPKEKTEFVQLYNEYFLSLSPLDPARYVGVLERMIALEPDIAFPYCKLGAFYSGFNDYEKAEGLLIKALEIRPGYDEAKINLANTYVGAGKYDEARELLVEVENDPTATPVELASAFYAHGELITAAASSPEKAIRYFEKAIELQRDYADPYFALAEIYEKTSGGEANAEEYAAEFVELEPRGPRAARMRAILGQEPVEVLADDASKAYEAGDYDEAAEYCRRAIELDPTYFEMRYNLVCCLALGGHPEEAMAELRPLVRGAPGVFDEALERDPDLDSLRDREDFKRLLE